MKKKNVKFNDNIYIKLFNKDEPAKNINFKSINYYKYYLIFICIILCCVLTKLFIL